MVQIQFSVKRLQVSVPDHKNLIDGELYASVKPDECVWTLEDDEEEKDASGHWLRVVIVTLCKAKLHETWTALLSGETSAPTSVDGSGDASATFAVEEMKKRMMLEKFQAEQPGFDFSGAEFTGRVPDDPNSFAQPT